MQFEKFIFVHFAKTLICLKNDESRKLFKNLGNWARMAFKFCYIKTLTLLSFRMQRRTLRKCFQLKLKQQPLFQPLRKYISSTSDDLHNSDI